MRKCFARWGAEMVRKSGRYLFALALGLGLFVIWPSRICFSTGEYPTDKALTISILRNLQDRYPEYFPMRSEKRLEDLVVDFPDCCTVVSAPYLVRLLTPIRVEYRFELKYSLFGRGLQDAILKGEADACGGLRVTERIFL